MFWFLRRTGATSFLNSFNSKTSKVASKNDKNISGAYQICMEFLSILMWKNLKSYLEKYVEEFDIVETSCTFMTVEAEKLSMKFLIDCGVLKIDFR